MAVAAQNINNSTIKSILLAKKLTSSNFTNWYRNLRIVLRYEKKIKFVEQLIGPALNPKTADPDTIDKYYESINLEQEELKTMFEEQAKQEMFETVKAFYACKQEDGQSVSSYVLKMKSYLDILEHLGYDMPNELSILCDVVCYLFLVRSLRCEFVKGAYGCILGNKAEAGLCVGSRKAIRGTDLVILLFGFRFRYFVGAGCYNYGIKARFSPVEPRFGEEVLIFCLRVRSLCCLFVKGAYGCILGFRDSFL
ncbi:hypothetical protein Tco_0412417 [Tanacetum coccineum]